jgi:hypothetical protein
VGFYNDTAVIEKIESLTKTVQRLESRVEELETHEDLWDLEKAIFQNGNQPLVPWNQAKALLDLE